MTVARVLGLDYGERRIGVAVSDGIGLTAQPIAVIEAGAGFADALGRLVQEYEPEAIVVGLPTSLDGTEGPLAEAARAFGADVADITGVAVEFYDERFTSAVAEQALLEANVRRGKRRAVRDKVAAAVMLQGYLEERRR